MSSVHSVKWCSCYLPSLPLGAALRTKGDSEGFACGNKPWKVNTVYRFKMMGRPRAENIGGENSYHFSNTYYVPHLVLCAFTCDNLMWQKQLSSLILKIENQIQRHYVTYQDHTATKRQKQREDLNPKSERRVQVLNQHDEMELTRVNKCGRGSFFFLFTYSFNKQEHSTHSVACSVLGPVL